MRKPLPVAEASASAGSHVELSDILILLDEISTMNFRFLSGVASCLACSIPVADTSSASASSPVDLVLLDWLPSLRFMFSSGVEDVSAVSAFLEFVPDTTELAERVDGTLSPTEFNFIVLGTSGSLETSASVEFERESGGSR